MKKHFIIRVSGKVQGVFFRASAKAKADELHVAGFVRNEHDGSVYLEAEGDEDNVKPFIQWCLKGPAHADVQKIDVIEGPVTGLSRFSIEH